MKIRTDFVTNSSSSSFVAVFNMTLQDGEQISMEARSTYGDYDSSSLSYGGDSLSWSPECDEKYDHIVLKVDTNHASIANLLECTDAGAVAKELLCWFDAELSADENCEEYCDELKFVVTGKLKYFENREELVEFIEDQGGYVTGSISSKTDYLICNDKNSTSSKVKKAKDLGISIISEAEFIRRFAPDEFDLEESDEADEVAMKALDKKNEILEAMKNNFTGTLTDKVNAVSDIKEMSLTMEFDGRGEFLKGADDVIGTIFGYGNFLKIEEIIAKHEDADVIKKEISSLDFMKHLTEESVDGMIKFVKECGREQVECTITQKLLENGMVSMKIRLY